MLQGVGVTRDLVMMPRIAAVTASTAPVCSLATRAVTRSSPQLLVQESPTWGAAGHPARGIGANC